MYSPFRPFSALLNRVANAREDFIVPGAPARRTTLPFGTPPARTGASSPSTWVSSSSTAAHLLHDPVEEGPELASALLEVRSPLWDVERGPERGDCGLRGLREAGDVLRGEGRRGLPELLQFGLQDMPSRGPRGLRVHSAQPLSEARAGRLQRHHPAHS